MPTHKTKKPRINLWPVIFLLAITALGVIVMGLLLAPSRIETR